MSAPLFLIQPTGGPLLTVVFYRIKNVVVGRRLCLRPGGCQSPTGEHDAQRIRLIRFSNPTAMVQDLQSRLEFPRSSQNTLPLFLMFPQGHQEPRIEAVLRTVFIKLEMRKVRSPMIAKTK